MKLAKFSPHSNFTCIVATSTVHHAYINHNEHNIMVTNTLAEEKSDETVEISY